jgi:2,3-bisphosphoglycerate-dependent phosphoglycerate mutase
MIMRKEFLVLAILFTTVSTALAQNTTVYIVRHAEKDLTDPNTKDPKLTIEGLRRAKDLNALLEKEGIVAVYSTNYIRTIQTADPVAKRIKKNITIYDATNITDLVATVKERYNSKSVLIIGHSNTILPMVSAFGGNTSISEIKDNEYRYLFKVVINSEKTTTTELLYGD